MLETVIARLPGDLDIRILPVQCVGKSNEHLHAPGTLTLTARTLIDAWTELGESSRAQASASSSSSIRTAATRRSWASSRANCACASPCWR